MNSGVHYSIDPTLAVKVQQAIARGWYDEQIARVFEVDMAFIDEQYDAIDRAHRNLP
jgi:hypothetical protein